MTQSPILPVAAGVIKNDQNQVLVALRPKHLHQGGLWEFPGGKIMATETITQALTRELQEELGITVTKASPLITLIHAYPEITVQLNVLRVDAFNGLPHGREGQEIRWIPVDELNNLTFPAANAGIISAAQLPDYYAILDAETLVSRPLLESLQQLLAQGIKLIQARLKNMTTLQQTDFLAAALPLCAEASAVLLINSSLPNAWAHENVHLTSHDLMRLQQRPNNLRWLAASCHNFAQIQHAEAIGVDFVVLAPVLKTLSHPDAPPLGWHPFTELVAMSKLPVYALGGMQRSDLGQAKLSGAQGLAGIRLFLT